MKRSEAAARNFHERPLVSSHHACLCASEHVPHQALQLQASCAEDADMIAIASKEHATSRRVGHHVQVLVVVCPAATAAPLSTERAFAFGVESSAVHLRRVTRTPPFASLRPPRGRSPAAQTAAPAAHTHRPVRTRPRAAGRLSLPPASAGPAPSRAPASRPPPAPWPACWPPCRFPCCLAEPLWLACMSVCCPAGCLLGWSTG